MVTAEDELLERIEDELLDRIDDELLERIKAELLERIETVALDEDCATDELITDDLTTEELTTGLTDEESGTLLATELGIDETIVCTLEELVLSLETQADKVKLKTAANNSEFDGRNRFIDGSQKRGKRLSTGKALKNYSLALGRTPIADSLTETLQYWLHHFEFARHITRRIPTLKKTNIASSFFIIDVSESVI